MKRIVVLNPLGIGIGNAGMQYLFARAHAERTGAELQMPPCIIQKVFQVDHPLPERTDLPRRTEKDVAPNESDIELRCYAQSQAAMIYTAAQARSWLPFRLSRKEILNAHSAMEMQESDYYVGHVRRGDFAGYGYPLVSTTSYAEAVFKLSGIGSVCRLVMMESATPHGNLPDELSFLPDFFRLVKAPILFRANSSFSWLAALLNVNPTFSPIISGLAGGIEHDCRFVPGNWPRLANFEFTTDLHLKE